SSGGGLVTRVVLVERPDTAIPEATRPNLPIELTLPPNLDPLAEARDRGRPLLVLRLGQRQVSAAELAAQGLAGTVLLPGDKVLPVPPVPPWVPWTCAPVYDPILGPPAPAAELCVPDGGDVGLPAGNDPY